MKTLPTPKALIEGLATYSTPAEVTAALNDVGLGYLNVRYHFGELSLWPNPKAAEIHVFWHRGWARRFLTILFEPNRMPRAGVGYYADEQSGFVAAAGQWGSEPIEVLEFPDEPKGLRPPAIIDLDTNKVGSAPGVGPARLQAAELARGAALVIPNGLSEPLDLSPVLAQRQLFDYVEIYPRSPKSRVFDCPGDQRWSHVLADAIRHGQVPPAVFAINQNAAEAALDYADQVSR